MILLGYIYFSSLQGHFLLYRDSHPVSCRTWRRTLPGVGQAPLSWPWAISSNQNQTTSPIQASHLTYQWRTSSP